jgi:hypothetical protein
VLKIFLILRKSWKFKGSSVSPFMEGGGAENPALSLFECAGNVEGSAHDLQIVHSVVSVQSAVPFSGLWIMDIG